ncbi:phage tail tape measure protein [Nocardia terpenica]|uniref:Phage tail tape measure protein n=1 Tax=Nocardia terpenica TaxID=455432 RepID=A0A164JV93_9NOCA|nr:phage tail tape measure protein [Nocardia terpenica]KZM70754.1 hypothetical protein AWN90_40045 [Nocardia terpenica]
MTPVYFDIVSRIVGLEAAAAEVVGKAARAGEQAGTGFADAFKRKVLGDSAAVTASMTTQVNAATSALETASVRVVKAKDAEADAAGRARVAETRLAEARQKYATDSAKYIVAEEKLERAKRATIAATNDVTTALAAEQRAQDALTARREQATASAGTLGLALKTAAVTGVGALGVAMGDAVKQAANFQETQTRLVTTAGESKDALAAVSRGVLDLAGQTGYSAAELSKAMYTVESASFHGVDGLTVIKAAAQGAAQEGAPLHDVVDALTTSLKDFQLPASAAADQVSQMIAAVSHGKTTFADFSASIGSVEEAAHQAHIPMSDLYADVATMTLHGISADRATQNLNRALTTLQKPSESMRQALANVGISAQDLSGKLSAEGLSGTMNDISQAIIGHLGPDHKVLVDAFNQDKLAAEDAGRAFAVMPKNLRDIATSFHDGSMTVGDYHKALKELAPEQANLLDHWAALDKKATGLNATLTSAKNTDLTYNQMLIAAMGNQETARVAGNLVGGDEGDTGGRVGGNFADVQAARRDVDAAHAEGPGNVKGWAEVQGNFNQKLAETKASIGATAIAIGTDLLPAATRMLDWLREGASWLQTHKRLGDDLIMTIGGIAAGWAAWKVASGTFALIKTGVEGITTDARLAGAGFSAISDGASAAASLTRDYWNWTGQFRVQAAKDCAATKISAVTEAAESAAAWAAQGARSAGAWTLMRAQAIRAFVATKAGAAAAAVETAGLWVAQNARVVASFVAVEGAVIATTVAQKGAAAAAWLLDAAMDANPVGLVVAGLTAVVAAVVYAWNHFTWFRDGVKEVWHVIWDDVIHPIVGYIVDYYRTWVEIAVWAYEKGIKPAMDGIGAVTTWLHDTVIKPVVELIKTEVRAWAEVYVWLHEHVIAPTGQKIGDALGLVKDAFKNTVDWIGDQWGRVEKIVGTPAVAIIDLVYNDGIVRLWNGIADVFHLGHLNAVDTSKIPHYALGGVHGVMSGWSPGVDDRLVAVGGGEAIMRPEWTRAVGPDYVHAANAAARAGGVSGVRQFLSGVPHFDSGGIVGDIVGWAKNVVGDAIDVATFTARMFTDPEGAVRALFTPVIDRALHAPDGGSDGGTSPWRDMLIGIPGQLVEAVIGQAKSWLSTGRSTSSTGGGGGVPFTGSPDVDGWIAQAIRIAGVGAGWAPGLKTIIGRESGGNPNAVNLWDSNAAAGHPSKGLMQTIDTTFERYRSKSLPDNPFDPVADLVAAIGYLRDVYQVSDDGANLAARVQQADPSRPPHGYATGGIVPGVTTMQKAVSGPEIALQQVREHAATMYAWGGSDLATGVDCSGLVSAAIQIAEGITNPTARLGNTTSMLAGQWPHVVAGASPADVFAIGANADHIAATILGTSIEARQSGERIRYGTDAVGAFDPQFTAQFHLDPTVFNPPYTARPTGSGTKTPQEKAQAYTDGARKALAAAKASDDAAAKHDQAAADYEAKATHAQQLADHAQGTARDKHLAAARDYEAKAKAAHDAADKARQAAAAHRAKAADDQQKAQQGTSQPATTGSELSPRGAASHSASTTGGLLTFEQLGERAGGLAAGAFLETFGLKDTLLADPNTSPLLKIAGQLGSLQLQGRPVFVNPLAPPQATAIPQQLKVTDPGELSGELPATHDGGGLIPPGLSIVNNKTGAAELAVLSPQQGKLAPAEQPRVAPDLGRSAPLLTIEHWHQHSDGGQADARAIVRELNVYSGALAR